MKLTVGILAYGSLTGNPGEEIGKATLEKKDGITTPFEIKRNTSVTLSGVAQRQTAIEVRFPDKTKEVPSNEF